MSDPGNRAVTRRSAIKTGGAAIGAFSLAGCVDALSGGDGDDSVDLSMSIAGGSWGEWVTDYFVEPWEEETGHNIDVQFQEAGALASELQANRDDPTLDLAHNSQTDAVQFGNQDLLEKHSEHVENYEDCAEAFRNEWIAGKVATPFGIGYNAELVDTEVTAWEDLMDPEFEGRVAIPSWGWVGNSWAYVLNDVLGGSADDISPALEFVEDLIQEQDAIIMDTTDHGLRLFEQEEIVIAPYWSARTDQIRLDTGINTEFVYPEEGAMLWTYNLSLVAGRGEENLEAAADFIGSTLNPERQAQFSSDMGYPPTVPEATEYIDEETIEERPTLDISQEDMDNMAKIDVDWVTVSESRDEHAEEWRRVVRA